MMPQVQVKDTNNSVLGSLELSERFALLGKEHLVHEALVNYLANQRQGTHATKTRGMVRGGGRKPWRQKHTGRARAGSIRSPLWRGGGVVFGPQPRDYSWQMPKTQRRLALFAALSRKLADGELTVLKGLQVPQPRTKLMVEILARLGLQDHSVLLVLSEPDRNVLLSARNIPRVDVVQAQDLNIYDVLSHQHLLITEQAMKVLEERPL
jgi:large subunit ribosomal protein L4